MRLLLFFYMISVVLAERHRQSAKDGRATVASLSHVTPLQTQGNVGRGTANRLGQYEWKFVKYHPSPWEVSWLNNTKDLDGKPGTPLCDLMLGKYQSQTQTYIQNLHLMTPDHPRNRCQNHIAVHPVAYDDAVFSKFEYMFTCSSPPCAEPHVDDNSQPGDVRFSYIEPLVGILRHPKACTKVHEWTGSKNYMIVDSWSLAPNGNAGSPRVLYFDAGASTWNSGGGGTSQSWFYDLYRSMCLQFTDMFLWEAKPHNPVEIFKEVPGEVKPFYRWFNVPLSADMASWDNPLNHLLSVAEKNDVVVMKIDFDNPSIEDALIDTIIKDRRVSQLIDELYFEHHVNQEIMNRLWGTTSLQKYHTDSLALFRKLRELGIRAHSWI